MNDPSFWFTLIAAGAAIISAVIAYLVYAAQTLPEIVVYTDYDVRIPTIIYLVIANLGKTAAREIKFQSSRPIPEAAFGVTENEVGSRTQKAFTHGPFISGIPFLAPGTTRRIMWGQYPGLFAALGNEPIHITATYRSRLNDILDWQAHKSESLIEVASYQTTEMGDNDPLRKVAKHLQRIADALENK